MSNLPCAVKMKRKNKRSGSFCNPFSKRGAPVRRNRGISPKDKLQASRNHEAQCLSFRSQSPSRLSPSLFFVPPYCIQKSISSLYLRFLHPCCPPIHPRVPIPHPLSCPPAITSIYCTSLILISTPPSRLYSISISILLYIRRAIVPSGTSVLHVTARSRT